MECTVTITGSVFIYVEKYRQTVQFIRFSRVMISVSVMIGVRARFSFIDAI